MMQAQVQMGANPGQVQPPHMGPGVSQQTTSNPAQRQNQNDESVSRCLANVQRLRENLEILLNTTKQAAMMESEESSAASASSSSGAPTIASLPNNQAASQMNNTLKNLIDRKLLEMSQSLELIGQSLDQYDFKFFYSQHTNINQYNELALEKQGTLLDEWSSNMKWSNKLNDFPSTIASTIPMYRRTNTRPLNTVSRSRNEGSCYQTLEKLANSDPSSAHSSSLTLQPQQAQTNKEHSINVQRWSDHLNLLEITLFRSGIVVILYLRQFIVEHVVCKPLNEKKQFGASFYHRNSSKYQALKLIAGHIRAASLFITGQTFQMDIALHKLVHYILRYNTLNSSKCTQCQKHLLNGLQPTWRDFKSYEAYHEECLS